jgi:alpha-L-fucosidase
MKSLLLIGALWFALPVAAQHAAPALTASVGANPTEAIARWQAMRFGLFIHWGPVSLKGTEIGWSRGAEVPIEEYDNLYRKFNPTNFDAGGWMQLAKEAGVKYVVFTTKHHDGFCNWNTRQTDYNIMRTPFGRDVVKELAAACKHQGLAFGTYYSTCDWHHPDFPLTSPGGSVRRPSFNLDRYEQYLRNQVAELITNYGPLVLMWFDVPQEFDVKRGQGVIDFVRSLQPDIVVNNRSGAPGDYDTPEQRIGKFQNDRPWETCMTICEQWAWKPGDKMKSLKECVQTLALCAGGDGNLLFNVAPMPDGSIETRQAQRLREIGAWLAQNGDAIYGTRGGPWKPTRSFASTRKGNTVFVHILRWTGDTVKLPNIPRKITRSSLLTGGDVSVRQVAEEITISVPSRDRQDIDTVVRLELDGPATELKPLDPSSRMKASASNVYYNDSDYGPDKAFDGDPETRWATDSTTRQAWIETDLGSPVTLSRVTIDEWGQRVQSFELQHWNGSEWKTFHRGSTIGAHLTQTFQPVLAQRIRLNILDASEGPTIKELQFFSK